MRSFILILLTALISFKAFAQNKTYLGFEVSLANDSYKLKDQGDYMKNTPLHNFPIGLHLRQDLSKKFFTEAGVMFKYYYEGFGFKEVSNNSSSSGDVTFLIPLRLGMKLNLYKEKIHFVPVVGYSFGIAPPYSSGIGYGISKSGNTYYEYTYSENPNVNRYFSLIQAGVGVEYKFFRDFIFSVSANRYTGLNKTTQLDIYYTANYSSPIAGTATSKGSFWSLSTAIKYPISNLWMKK